jgi:hypothetical protein
MGGGQAASRGAPGTRPPGSDTPVLCRAPATAPSRFSQCALHPATIFAPQSHLYFSLFPFLFSLFVFLSFCLFVFLSLRFSLLLYYHLFDFYHVYCRDAPRRVRINLQMKKVSRRFRRYADLSRIDEENFGKGLADYADYADCHPAGICGINFKCNQL